MATQCQPQCCCTSTPSKPCNNCLNGKAPRRLKLVVPSGTFIDAGDGFGGPGPCPTGCDFYTGTFLFDMDLTPQTAGCGGGNCCGWFLCFDGPASTEGCDCSLEQTTDACKQFCVININLLPPDGTDVNYRLEVEFSSGNIDTSICGDCNFATGKSLFKLDFTTTKPDCMSWNNLEIPLDVTFGSTCIADTGTSVFISVA